MNERQIRLNQRDLGLLQDVYRSRVLSLDQLSCRHFEGRYKAASERLRKLSNGRFIERLTYLDQLDTGEARRAFSLTKKGLGSLYRRDLISQEQRKRRFRLKPAPNQVLHHVTLNDLEEQWGVEFEREHTASLSPGNSKVKADAYIKNPTSGEKPVYVELDLGQYSAKRVRDKVCSLAPEASELIFVTPTESRAEWLEKQANDASPYYSERCKNRREMKNFQAVYYRDSKGIEPVERYIERLPVKHRRTVRNQIDRLNLCSDEMPHLPFPGSSQIEGELRELRCHFGSTHYRIFYRRSKRLFVLLRIFEKKTKQVPSDEIAIATDRWHDFKDRMEAKPRKPPRAAGADAP